MTMSHAELLIDARRTCLQRRFFTTFAFDTRDELLAAVTDLRLGVETIAQSADSKREVYSGWSYWLLFLKGYLDATASDQLDDDNVYLDYLVRYYGPRRHDPGIADDLTSPGWARDRVERRFALLDAAAQVGAGEEWVIEPIGVQLDETPPEHPLLVFSVGAAAPLQATLVDGWHRLFAARLWDVAAVPGRAIGAHAEAVA
jgi:hypothetical protein